MGNSPSYAGGCFKVTRMGDPARIGPGATARTISMDETRRTPLVLRRLRTRSVVGSSRRRFRVVGPPVVGVVFIIIILTAAADFFFVSLARAETAVAAEASPTTSTASKRHENKKDNTSFPPASTKVKVFVSGEQGLGPPSAHHSGHESSSPPAEDDASASSEASGATDPGTEPESLADSESSVPDASLEESGSPLSTLDPLEMYLYWHDELPRRVHGWLVWLGSHLANVARHQPPVGLVSLLLACRVGGRIWSGVQQALAELDGDSTASNGGSMSSASSSDDSQRSQAATQHSRRNRRPRRNRWGSTAYTLDRGDDAYPAHGGVQPNRLLLCMTVLQQQMNLDIASKDLLKSPDGSDPTRDMARRWLLEAMSVNAQAVDLSTASSLSSPLLDFCRQVAAPLSQVSGASLINVTSNVRRPASAAASTAAPSTTTTTVEELAYWTCQLRAHDALLRVVRDRLLQSTVRLARTAQHWKKRRRVLTSAVAAVATVASPGSGSLAASPYSSGFGGVQGWWHRHVVQRRRQWVLEMDHDQKSRWAVAQASYRAEATKLGRVTSVLIQQPDDLDPSHLILITSHEPTPGNQQEADGPPAPTTGDNAHHDGSSAAPRRGPGQWLPQYSMRWVADGKGHVSIRKLDPNPMAWWESPGPSQPRDDRRGDPFGKTVEGQVDAVRQAQAWVHEARQVIAQVVQETVETSVPEPNRNYDRDVFLNNSTERRQSFDAWCASGQGSAGSDPGHDPEQELLVWNRVITYCDALSSWRRPGEGRVVRWWDLAVVGWTRKLDFLGIPTSFLYYRLAQLVHTKIHPYLPSLREDLSELVQTLWSIVQQRVLVPVRQIVLDILNQNKGMMSAFSLDEEQLSLDRMLRDLDLADGSPGERRLGLQRATEQYEQILQRGLLSNLLKGRLVRLLLIQVQQLKVGLLSALDTIDVLMQGNRIHFYALATIPSILIAYYSFRFFLRFLYSVRAKDPRPVSSAHADMTLYLDAMEGILLKSDGGSSSSAGLRRPGPEPGWPSPQRRLRLSPLEVGELVLHVHRYLLLLDFGSPPFPIPDCLYIHEGLQELFHHPGLFVHPGGDVSVDVIHDNHLLSFLGTVRRKHRGLLESSY